MEHSFNIEVAKKLGIAPAVILNNLYFWIEKNKANDKHFYDGYYWTYNSRKAYCVQFPYFTERQIEYALRKLIDGGYVITGNYNKVSYDRTLWYAITKEGYSILQNCEMESTKMQDGFSENVDPIPDNNTDSKQKDKPFPTEKGGASKKSSSYDEVFNAPENEYIREALIKWVKACKNRGVGFQYKTLERWASILRDNAGESPEAALAIVDQSIDAGWKDLYKLKKKPESKPRASMERFDPDKDKLATGTDGKPLVY